MNDGIVSVVAGWEQRISVCDHQPETPSEAVPSGLILAALFWVRP